MCPTLYYSHACFVFFSSCEQGAHHEFSSTESNSMLNGWIFSHHTLLVRMFRVSRVFSKRSCHSVAVTLTLHVFGLFWLRLLAFVCSISCVCSKCRPF